MIIRRPRPESNFYILDKRISQDKRLSWAARGMLIYLLGKPDNWRVSVADLVNQTADSGKASRRDGVYAILKELQDAGYVQYQQGRKDDGTMGAGTYHVSEDSARTGPDEVEPLPEKPIPAAPTLTRIEGIPSTERTKTDVELAFDRWRELFHKARAKLDPARQRAIAKAVQAYGLPAVLQCLEGYSRSTFHLGQNDRRTRFDDITLFLRDAAHIEAGVSMATQPVKERGFVC